MAPCLTPAALQALNARNLASATFASAFAAIT
jgi:hypothetical protein